MVAQILRVGMSRLWRGSAYNIYTTALLEFYNMCKYTFGRIVAIVQQCANINNDAPQLYIMTKCKSILYFFFRVVKKLCVF